MADYDRTLQQILKMSQTLSNDSSFLQDETYLLACGSPSPETLFIPAIGLNRRCGVQVRNLESSQISRIATILDFSEDY